LSIISCGQRLLTCTNPESASLSHSCAILGSVLISVYMALVVIQPAGCPLSEFYDRKTVYISDTLM